MSTLSSLISGADCGPVNPLQGLAKRFDADRGAQQDQFRSGRAGSSREVFRSQEPQANPALLREATDFFQGSSSSAVPFQGPAAFDLQTLNAAIHAHPATRAPVATFSPNSASWANDFSNQANATQSSTAAAWAGDFMKQSQGPSVAGRAAATPARDAMAMHTPPIQQGPMLQRPQYDMAMANLALMQQMQPLGMMGPMQQAQPIIAQPSQTTQDLSSWASHFSQVDSQLTSNTAPQPEVVANDLAETAGLLINALKTEQNEKFKNSAFLGLMRQVRDREMVIDGNDLVASSSSGALDSQASIPSSLKGKGVVRDMPILGERPKSVHFEQGTMDAMANELMNLQLNMAATKAAGMDVDEAVLQQFVDTTAAIARADAAARQVPNYFAQQEAEWAHMQQDWDEWDATATGLQKATTSMGRLNEHQYGHRSVLEKEAAIQRDPSNANAWLDLGVRQQENEREEEAIDALTRAVELDPTLLPAWLALAISHTNEGNRFEANRAIRQWISHNEQYSTISARYNVKEESAERNVRAMRSELIDCLLDMANAMHVGGGLDADVQVALAVLLNTSEDFERAQDCFKAALEVRPDDWQLYNRVGATMANSGKAEEALPYYYRALELNPGYIRARFNLGISCINLHKYEEAASHVLDALILQETEGTQSNASSRGVTSSALWDALRTTAVHLERPDLAALCEKKDLSAFRAEFVNHSEA
ncbi:hypothetical protein FRB93_004257 [Tulasnella sp. JGI-2019a]|nr:hypothetical protein FRB93_004257 [Tulasnella sp. JGI-2019a]